MSMEHHWKSTLISSYPGLPLAAFTTTKNSLPALDNESLASGAGVISPAAPCTLLITTSREFDSI